MPARQKELYLVASFTDAWIETDGTEVKCNRSHVASFTDAWIETRIRLSPPLGTQSHLLQMRGLKPYKIALLLKAGEVASFTDAWIET